MKGAISAENLSQVKGVNAPGSNEPQTAVPVRSWSIEDADGKTVVSSDWSWDSAPKPIAHVILPTSQIKQPSPTWFIPDSIPPVIRHREVRNPAKEIKQRKFVLGAVIILAICCVGWFEVGALNSRNSSISNPTLEPTREPTKTLVQKISPTGTRIPPTPTSSPRVTPTAVGDFRLRGPEKKTLINGATYTECFTSDPSGATISNIEAKLGRVLSVDAGNGWHCSGLSRQ